MTPMKATHQQTKQHNRDLVLKTIFNYETVSRAEIARITKLTRATVSDLVAELLGEGLVEEVGYGSSMGGKSPILLSVVADARYLIGLNLAQDKFIGAVVNLRGKIKETIEVPVSGSDSQQALQSVYEILDQLLSKGWAPVMGIGVGAPGLINTRKGVIVNAVNLDWNDLPLAKYLQARYDLPVSVLNDSQAAAIGEYVYGWAGKSEGNLVVVNVRQGIGAGILINGRLFQGDGGGAGEIGHVVMLESGVQCRCGKKGCLETIASTRAIVQRFQSLAGSSQAVSLDSVLEAYLVHDPRARQVVSEAGCYLGKSLASLVSTLNIQHIVLTGDMTRFGEDWLQSVGEAMRRSTLTKLANNTKLDFGKLGFHGCILGASAFMLLGGYSLLFQSEDN